MSFDRIPAGDLVIRPCRHGLQVQSAFVLFLQKANKALAFAFALAFVLALGFGAGWLVGLAFAFALSKAGLVGHVMWGCLSPVKTAPKALYSSISR